MDFDGTQTVAEIARQYPATVPVFEAFGIDYCCGGNRPLEVACARHDVSLNLVLSDLSSALVTRPGEDERHWITRPLADLSAHIVEQHHAYAKRELPRLAALAAKVEARHGQMYPEMHEIRELVNAMSSEMCTHMLKEEQVLFPRLKLVEEAADSGVAAPPAFFGALINPIRHMMNDHDDTGQLLKSLRNLTHDYSLPEHACMSFQALYHGLEALEKDLHQHIHLENNILFPRALEVEQVN
jgi:regulator of cell morphogenesis and NO signaling